MDLRKNALTGQLWILCIFSPELKVLIVGYNKLHGVIPPWITKLIQLQVLNLSNNKISGRIPWNLERLQGFRIIKFSRVIIHPMKIYVFFINEFGYTLTYLLVANKIFEFSTKYLNFLRLLNYQKNSQKDKYMYLLASYLL